MMSKKEDQSREQVIMISLDDLVPENHLVRALDKTTVSSLIWLKTGILKIQAGQA